VAAPDQLPVHGLVPDHAPGCLEARSRPGQPTITVVVATRDRTASLERTLASLERLRYRPFDVVVVDSAPSTAETRLALQERSTPFALRYVRASRPGLALAHNTALDLVTGDVVAFTDDDVEVDPWWLSAVAETFAETEVTCVTGLILAAELETSAQLWVEQAGGFARGFEERRFSLARPSPDPLFPFTAGRFGSGANMSFRTGWLRDRGGFDRAMGAGTPARGGDDLAAFCRVVLDGDVLAYQPAAIVRHWHRRDYAGLRRQSFGYGIGLGAYLTATAWRQPSLVAQMARRAGPAAAHLLAHDSAKNQGKRSDFPVELTWRERAGLALGPPAYLLSRWRYRSTTPWGATS
jgi:glycosyltransferase involved in cell wall biosynthesis